MHLGKAIQPAIGKGGVEQSDLADLELANRYGLNVCCLSSDVYSRYCSVDTVIGASLFMN